MNLRHLLYPLFGVLVIVGYASAVRRGFDPAAVRDNERATPAGAPQQRASSRYRSPSVIWVGGFGGK